MTMHNNAVLNYVKSTRRMIWDFGWVIQLYAENSMLSNRKNTIPYRIISVRNWS